MTHRLMPCPVVAAATIACPAVAQCDIPWMDLLRPDNPLDGDGLGAVMAGDRSGLEPIRFAAGVPADDDQGDNAGAVYVYTLVADVWETEKITPFDGAAFDFFGSGVALYGNTLVVGAPRDDDHGTDSGSVYVYAHEAAGWGFVTKLAAADAEVADRFGGAVGLSGDRLIVGAEGDDDLGSAAGAAYVFERDGDAWSQVDKLLASDGEAGDKFGRRVVIDGATAAVGTPDKDVYEGSVNDGMLYVFESAEGAFAEVATLAIDQAEAGIGASLGASLDLSGDLLVAGAPGVDQIFADEGAIGVSVRDEDGSWGPLLMITSETPLPDKALGTSVAIGAGSITDCSNRENPWDTIFGGAPGYLGGVGLVEAFIVSEGVYAALNLDFGQLQAEARFAVGLAVAYRVVRTILGVGAPRLPGLGPASGEAPAGGVFLYDLPLDAACIADVDGSGAVDFADVLRILGAWGPCGGCAEDLDGNGTVGFEDILVVLSAWGPCP